MVAKKLVTNEERIAFLNSKMEELTNEQEQDLVSDYDQALSEYKNQNKPFLVRFKGKVFEVPRSMPFSFSMFYMRHCIVKINGKTQFQIPDDKIEEFVCRMFGKTFYSELELSDDVEMGFVLGTLVPDIFAKWGYGINRAKTKSVEKNG